MALKTASWVSTISFSGMLLKIILVCFKGFDQIFKIESMTGRLPILDYK